MTRHPIFAAAFDALKSEQNGPTEIEVTDIVESLLQYKTDYNYKVRYDVSIRREHDHEVALTVNGKRYLVTVTEVE